MRDEFGPVDPAEEGGAVDETDSPREAFVTEEDAEALQMERAILGEDTAAGTMRRIFNENAAEIALGIVKIAKHDANGNTRLRAQIYVTDRILGRIGDDLGEDDELKAFIGSFVKNVEKHANEAR